MPITLNHRDGDVLIEELPDARFRLHVTPASGAFVHCTDWTTAYPLDLIKLILEINKQNHWSINFSLSQPYPFNIKE